MLSSQPLCFNLFGDLKLNPDKGNKFFQQLFPDYVAEVEAPRVRIVVASIEPRTRGRR
jgi:hypothetical protein